jgi:redox-sensitive bicupin YhaK (pirin superfamily)
MKPLKSIRAVYRAGYKDYDGLDTYSVMPTRNVPIDALDPFLFLNHHGLQTYPPGNQGLPFGPHPHKGFETVTFIIEGDLVHKDSTGFNSNIKAGGIQWMTAGNGIIHSETSSDEFQEKGGEIEILQLWLNLPAKFKNVAPNYIGLQKNQVPRLTFDNDSVVVNLVSGSWEKEKAPIQSLSNVHLFTIEIKKGATLNVDVAANRTVLFYLIKGALNVNGSEAEIHELVEFDHVGETISIEAKENVLILFGHAEPNNEPIAAHGPFVMNTTEEIRQAFLDYHEGKFGVWDH